MSSNLTSVTPVPGSFRDPSGTVFKSGDQLYRQVNACYADEYDHLVESGLAAKLIENGYLIPHEEVEPAAAGVAARGAMASLLLVAAVTWWVRRRDEWRRRWWAFISEGRAAG